MVWLEEPRRRGCCRRAAAPLTRSGPRVQSTGGRLTTLVSRIDERAASRQGHASRHVKCYPPERPAPFVNAHRHVPWPVREARAERAGRRGGRVRNKGSPAARRRPWATEPTWFPSGQPNPSRTLPRHQNIGVGMSPQRTCAGGVSTAVTAGPEMSTRATTIGSRPYARRMISRPAACGTCVRACVKRTL
jgi:hypothetical protein